MTPFLHSLPCHMAWKVGSWLVVAMVLPTLSRPCEGCERLAQMSGALSGTRSTGYLSFLAPGPSTRAGPHQAPPRLLAGSEGVGPRREPRPFLQSLLSSTLCPSICPSHRGFHQSRTLTPEAHGGEVLRCLPPQLLGQGSPWAGRVCLQTWWCGRGLGDPRAAVSSSHSHWELRVWTPDSWGSLSSVEWRGLSFLLLQLCLEPGDRFLPSQ